MDEEKPRFELTVVLVFVGLMWAVYVADLLLPVDLTQWGIVPRTLSGLVGIPASPFLHGGFGHLLGNTIPLVLLLVLLIGSRADSVSTIAELVLLSGGLLWLVGRNGTSQQAVCHVGASGLIYALIAFLIVAGFRERKIVSALVALVVAGLYGSTLLFGVLPSPSSNVSWDGHLAGAIAGAALAYFTVGKDSEAKRGAGGSPSRVTSIL